MGQHAWISCPQCRRGNLRIRPELAGRRVRCKHCLATFIAPEGAGPSGAGETEPVEVAALAAREGLSVGIARRVEALRSPAPRGGPPAWAAGEATNDDELERLRARYHAALDRGEAAAPGSPHPGRARPARRGRQGVASRGLEWLVFALLIAVLRRKIVAHVRAVRGLRHLPRVGPAILVANHQSYFDSFLIVSLAWMLTGRRVRVPTKVKAFRGWPRAVLHRAWGCVPIDPTRPDSAYATIASLLDCGRIVLVFPEGRRAEGPEPLPFHFGAFNLAARRGVPIVPVALRDSGLVIPKGRLWFVRNQTASLVVGRPIDPRGWEDRPRADRRDLARRLRDRAQRFITRAVAAREESLFHPRVLRREAAWLDEWLRRQIEHLLDKGIERIRPREASHVMTLSRLASCLGHDPLRFRVHFLRAWGFWLRSAPGLAALPVLSRYRREVESSLMLNQREPYLNYCLGQYHLQVPRLLGGRPREAAFYLERCYANAAAYGAEPVRFAVGLAEALAAVGRHFEAIALLIAHFDDPARPDYPRLKRRRARALALLRRLTGVPIPESRRMTSASPFRVLTRPVGAAQETRR